MEEFADAGMDELYIQQIGGGYDGFFRAYEREVLPASTDGPSPPGEIRHRVERACRRTGLGPTLSQQATEL